MKRVLMEIGVPKEIKDQEFRIGMTPTMVQAFTSNGHIVKVQKDAGKRIGFDNEMFEKAGAKVVSTIEEVYDSEMVVKVKEPQPEEYPLLKEGQILFCYLHLAPDPEQLKALIKQKIVGIAYETVTQDGKGLPLLTPMSEIAGRLSIQAGAMALQMVHGGSGTLMGGVPGVPPAEVVIIGGGIVGTQAAHMAVGLGADVTILDRDLERLRYLDNIFRGRVKLIYSSPEIIGKLLKHTDLVVGAVLICGKHAPLLVTEEMIQSMKKGSVLVDVAIDQGGCFATSKPTTHSDPIFIKHDVVHYCVANIPGAVASTATKALVNATFPYAFAIANKGYKKALADDPHLLNGLNVYRSLVTNEAVAQDLNYDYTDPKKALGI